MVITLGRQYNVGEKPTVILYTYINRHAEHQQKGRQNNTSSNNKDKSNTIIETSTAEDHDDENLHNPSTRPRYSPGSRRRAVGDHTRRYEASGKNWVPRSITYQGYDTQMLLMHGRSYGPALTRNTKERASVYQSDKVGLRPTNSCNLPYDSPQNCLQLQHVTPACLLFRTVVPKLEISPAPFSRSFLKPSCIFLQSGTIVVLWVH